MSRSSTIYKPGYEGEQLPHRTTPSERAKLAERRHELVERIHTALLVSGGVSGVPRADLGIRSGDAEYLVEFSDLVGQEKDDEERSQPPRFRPSPTQVDDMLPALNLLEGLRPPFIRVVFLRALWLFQENNGWDGDWSWDKIGERHGMSGQWARDAYDAVIVQAARRAGYLPKFTPEHAVLFTMVLRAGAECVSITTAADPRQQMYDLRSKCPLPLEEVVALWTAGAPLAKRICQAVRDGRKRDNIHATWHWGRLDQILSEAIAAAKAANAPWSTEDLYVAPRRVLEPTS